MCSSSTRHGAAWLFTSLLVTYPAAAQQRPDAGQILREQPAPPVKPAPGVKPAPAAKPEAVAEDTGPRVLVKEVRVKGATLIPEAELLEQLRPLIGVERSFAELQAAALVLIGYYAARGYLARAFLPPQELKDGVVEFQVIEGTRGSLEVEPKDERIDAARIGRFIERRFAAGAPFDLRALGEAMGIVNELPGVEARANLAPGAGESAVDVKVEASARPLIAASVDANNHGSRGTGVFQASGTLSFNNPSGRFDAGSLLLNLSEGSAFARGDWSLALGDRGFRLGASASSLAYRLVQESFRPLGARGTADTLGLNASYPVARLAQLNLSLTGSFEHKRLIDRVNAGETGNRRVNVAQIGLGGYSIVDELGVVNYSLGLTAGDSDQKNAGALAADQAARRTQGGFTKQGWSLGLLRPLGEELTAVASLRGQFAGKNLDSSERFSLGGARGVRAYPSGEAQGDYGVMMNLEGQWRLDERWTLSGFVDAGRITVNRNIPDGNTALNAYSLSGAGLGIDRRFGNQGLLRAMLAAPIGTNPGRDAAGNDSDGRKSRARFWISLAMQF